ncbi:hypothetical protein ACRALDRAFT_211496 [Sodiomyces alcalophilus JCM 7366]|uniref:uncharacterized protein n=1 Tax=Sodiomyces alcalophilus JCM 7366 TaxID=591952 RepID=UPI0039B4B3DE
MVSHSLFIEDTPDYQHPTIYRRNTLPPRSYCIPERPWPETEDGVSSMLPALRRPPSLTNFTAEGAPTTPIPSSPSLCVSHSSLRQSHWNLLDSDAQLHLRFDGADNAYHAWVTGALVDYTKAPETPYLHREPWLIRRRRPGLGFTGKKCESEESKKRIFPARPILGCKEDTSWPKVKDALMSEYRHS